MTENRRKTIRAYIGDDGELLQPFPLSDVTDENDDELAPKKWTVKLSGV